MTARTFDWKPREPDTRDWPVSRLLRSTTGTIETRNWRIVPRLDQGAEGACTGFAMAHALGGYPHPQPVSSVLATQLYDEAKQVDEWPGEAYEGTSTLGVCRAAKGRGLIESYYWCASVEEIGLAVSHVGPVLLGCFWRESLMDPVVSHIGMTPTAAGVSGEKVGGHEVVVHGYHADDDLYRIRNSWGPGWAHDGDVFVTTQGLRTLFDDEGDAAVVQKVA